jgi:predicted phage terminase large subunit-like protein
VLLAEVTGDAIRAEKIRRSLSAFIREAWVCVEPDSFVDNWHIDVIAEHLEAVTRGEIKRLIINQPPRSSKSLIVNVMWQAWEWLSRPEGRWLTMSYAQALSLRDSTKVRRLVRHEGLADATEQDGLMHRVGYQGLLRALDRDWELTGDVNAKGRYENTAGGYRIATSFGGVATGEGGDRIVIDDPHNAKKAESDIERQNALDWYDSTIPTRVNNAESAIVVVQQRLHDQDLTGHLLERGGWEIVCLPGMYERNHPHAFIDDPRTEEGETLDPVRLPPERFDELKLELGSYGFSGQIQQRPSPAEGGILKRDWWQFYDAADPPPFQTILTSWDMAFKDNEDSDWVVGQMWGKDLANCYLLAQVRGRLSFTNSKKAVLALDGWGNTRRYQGSVLVEDKANGTAIVDVLRGVVSSLIAVNPEGGKVSRAEAISPMVEAGNVYLPGGFIPAPPGYEQTKTTDLIEECAAFPTGAHDDMVDAHTQGLLRLRRGGGTGGVRTATRKRGVGDDI